MKKQKTKIQMKKQKARERKGKAKVAARRDAKRREDKIKRLEKEALDAEASEFDKVEPIRNPDTIERQEKERSDAAMAKLEHNLQILQALEEEHLKEQLQHEEINQRLEEAGCTTMEEKVRYLKDEIEKDVEKYHMKDISEKAIESDADIA